MSDYPKPPSTSEPMSQAAADSMIEAAGSLREAVLRVIDRHGPIAEWQIEELLHLEGNTVRPRIWELAKVGRVKKSGSGITPSGRTCNLYVVDEPPTGVPSPRPGEPFVHPPIFCPEPGCRKALSKPTRLMAGFSSGVCPDHRIQQVKCW